MADPETPAVPYEQAVIMEELAEQGVVNVKLRAEVRYWQGLANVYKAELDKQRAEEPPVDTVSADLPAEG